MEASAEGLEEGSDSLAATGEGLPEVLSQVASDGSQRHLESGEYHFHASGLRPTTEGESS